MKYCIDKYPMGSFPGQRTPGRYIDGFMYENLKFLAKNIVNDNTFLSVYFSSTFEVGAGKTTKASQDAECYTELVNQIHGLNISFTMKNIVFRPKDLMTRAFDLPKYSCIILDEWEDAHYWSELGITLRQFFRKCRQLNLFIIIIIPNFFQLPINYAVGRSVYACDVRFEGEFERGYFRFYNFDKKRELYIKGKKTYDYEVVKSNFFGRFPLGYSVEEDEYRKAKYLDMLKQEKETEKPYTEKQMKVKIFKKLHQNLPELTIKRLGEGFGISDRTASRWLSEEDENFESPEIPDYVMATKIHNNSLINDDLEGGLEPNQ